jgi:hypothetical protein
MYQEVLGTVTVSGDGGMDGDTESAKFRVETWQRGGLSSEEFVLKYSNWSNGYSSAKAE